jgi:hypothetical protein
MAESSSLVLRELLEHVVEVDHSVAASLISQTGAELA